MTDHPLMLQAVTLICDVLDRGRHFPAGSVGVVVDVLQGGESRDSGIRRVAGLADGAGQAGADSDHPILMDTIIHELMPSSPITSCVSNEVPL